MGIHVNSRPQQAELVVNIDPYDRLNGDSGYGGGGIPGFSAGQYNIAPKANTYGGVPIPYVNSTRLDQSYLYPVTIHANTYPEGNYGTNGLFNAWNSASNTIYSFSRALHLYVYVPGQGWLSSSFFNGARLNGHCYDNYGGAETGYVNELNKFAADYTQIKSMYPKATYIVVGSHAADQYIQSTVDILIDLGAPSYVSNWVPSPGRPEFILVGQPGLGPSKAFGWVNENVSAQRATLNMMLPATLGGDILFDGSSDYMTLSDPEISSTDFTIELVLKPTSASNDPMIITPNSNGIDQFIRLYGNNSIGMTVCVAADSQSTSVSSSSNSVPNGQYTYCTFTSSGNKIKVYINGILSSTSVVTHTVAGWTGSWFIGQRGNSTYYYNGRIGLLRVYKGALSESAVYDNFSMMKKRFNI